MKDKIKWIIPLLIITFVTSLTYIITSNLLENNSNLLFRDWILAFVTIICAICIFIIIIIIVINLNNIIEKRLNIANMWKFIIQTISNILISLVILGFPFICILILDLNYEEIGVETYKGEKYVVRSHTPWFGSAEYYYHPYINFFVYEDVEYSGEVKWEDYSEVEINDEQESHLIPDIIDEDTDKVIEVEEIKVISSNVEYVQNIGDNLSYGFYLIDHAMHQYLYAFVKSKDEGVSWDVIHTFPATSEIYYVDFLDRDLGFVNFGSSEELSLFMSTDSGLTWETILIDLPKGNTGMLYVRDINKYGEEIELILGVPSWTNPNNSIKYISKDKGLSWEFESVN